MVVNQKVVGSNSVCRAKYSHFEFRVLLVDWLVARTRPEWPTLRETHSLRERTAKVRICRTRLRTPESGPHSHTLRRGMLVWLTALVRYVARSKLPPPVPPSREPFRLSVGHIRTNWPLRAAAID